MKARITMEFQFQMHTNAPIFSPDEKEGRAVYEASTPIPDDSTPNSDGSTLIR